MIEDITKYLIDQYNPMAILWHGSRVRGDATPSSDYDILIITSTPNQVKSHEYHGAALDLEGASPDLKIIQAGDGSPIWPIQLLFDTVEKAGETLLRNTEKAYLTPRPSLSDSDWQARQAYTTRLINRIMSRGQDPLVRNLYLADFQYRMIRYWFEKNQRWTCSLYLALPIIEREDSAYFQLLKNLWSDDYPTACQELFDKIFNATSHQQ